MDLKKRVDRCILHALKSVGVGLVAGLVASTLIFKRQRWAFILAAGYGAGSAIAGCDHELFFQEYLEPCEEAKKKKEEKDKKEGKDKKEEKDKTEEKDKKKKA